MKKHLQMSGLLALASLLIACQVTPGLAPSAPATLRAQAAARTDWKRFVENDLNRVFNENDKNHDGVIQPAEIPYAPRAFAALDKDHNGVLSRAESLPDSGHIQYLTDYMVQHFQTDPSPARSGEDPQLQPLPTPAELEKFEAEIARPIPRMVSSQHKIPVLLVPGYAEPSWYFMSGLYKDLKSAGYEVEGINLFPNFASAEEQAQKVKERVDEMKKRLGVNQVNLVVHSFGGLISRYYIQNLGGVDTVKNLVTIATPHLGTYVSYLGPGDSASQMRPNSDFLQSLNGRGFAYSPVKYTSLWTNLDEIVVPPKNSIMPDSTVGYVPWTGHLTIMFSSRTYKFVRTALSD